VVRALRAGRTYGVTGSGGVLGIRLKSLESAGMTVTVTLDTTAARIEFIGRGGVVRAVRRDAAEAAYTFAPDDPYIRVRAVGARNVLTLNPVVRTDGSPAPRASVDWVRSILLWLAAGVAYLYALRRIARWGCAPVAA